MPDDIQQALRVLATALGTRDKAPEWPFDNPPYAQPTGRPAEMSEWRAFPELLRRLKLFSAPNEPQGERVPLTSPLLRSAVHEVTTQHPQAAAKATAFRFEPLPAGELGAIVGGRPNRAQITIDPKQLIEQDDLFAGDSPLLKLVDALRHELAHAGGYTDWGRGNTPDRGYGRYSAQQVDEASHLLHKKR